MKIVFENFFTSILLLHELEKKVFYSTGITRANRVHSTKLDSDTALKKRDRGSYHELGSSRLCLVKWMDDRSVIIGYSRIGSGEVKEVEKW